MDTASDDFSNLDAAGRSVATAARRPGRAVYPSLGLAIALSWLLLLSMARRAAEIAPPAEGAPGDGLLLTLPPLPLPAAVETLFELCLNPVALGAGWTGFAALVAMWFLMALATMLPSAAPMVRTFCEIADTAAAKGERVAHPGVLVAGYLTVWFGASMAFAALTMSLAAAGPVASPATGIAGAAALLLAGAYQFSRLKQACLEKCRNPFAVLFANWSPRPLRIFRLGLEQGVWCLGCCWALMLVMFAVGLMNIFWMSLIGVFALVEKQVGGHLTTRLSGGILLVWGAALLVVSL